MSTDQNSPGYHFNVAFMPEWHKIIPLVVSRARQFGYQVDDAGHEVQPLASALTFAGTLWAGLARGGVRFDVLEHRRDLRASVVQRAGALVTDSTFHFGLAHPERLGGGEVDESRAQVAVGVWLRDGSLALLGIEHENGRKDAEVTLASLAVWDGLDDLWNVALGAFAASSGGGESFTNASPSWAPEFTMRTRVMPDGLRAILRHPNISVGIGVQPMLLARTPDVTKRA